MTTEKAMLLKEFDEVYFAENIYKVARVKEFPHGIMVGIYDERRHSNRIDYLKPESLGEVIPCNDCQGGGCPTCNGFGRIIQ